MNILKFNLFLKELKTKSNLPLIETIFRGVNSIFESTETDAILDIMTMQNISWDDAEEIYNKKTTPHREKEYVQMDRLSKLLNDIDEIDEIND